MNFCNYQRKYLGNYQRKCLHSCPNKIYYKYQRNRQNNFQYNLYYIQLHMFAYMNHNM